MCNEEFPVFTLEIHFLTCEKTVSEIRKNLENHSNEPSTFENEENLNGLKNTVDDEKYPSLQFKNINCEIDSIALENENRSQKDGQVIAEVETEMDDAVNRKNMSSNHKQLNQQVIVKSILENIIKNSWKKAKKHDCDKCEKKFTRKYTLQKHARAVHLKDESIKCNHCEKCFTTKHNLKQHISFVHRKLKRKHEIKKYRCELCPRIFRRKIQRAKHLSASHGENIDFKCNICNECFASEQNLNRHLNLNHANQVEQIKKPT